MAWLPDAIAVIPILSLLIGYIGITIVFFVMSWWYNKNKEDNVEISLMCFVGGCGMCFIALFFMFLILRNSI